MIRKIFATLTAVTCFLQVSAQKSYNEQVQDYIAQFKDLAVQEQQRTGVPAAITLAQGIFETAAGSSELCTNASNHFGIKCKNTWTGDTYTYTDDAKDECFRKYRSATISYQDHSDFLKNNKRYSALFALSPTDYAAWAYGLKRCGYATNPQYATKLIKTIEDFKLQEYTYAALNGNPEEVLLASAQEKAVPRTRTTPANIAGENNPASNEGQIARDKAQPTADTDEIIVEKAIPQSRNGSYVTDYYQATSRNGLKGFFARKGDMLLEYAIKNKIRYAKLLEMNDLPDAPLEADMFVYLERKAKTGMAVTHKVEDGETLLQISQKEGIQLQQLRAFNHLEKGEEPLPGAMLQLQSTSEDKPALYTAGRTVAANTYAARSTSPTTITRDDGYVAGGGKTTTNTTKESPEEEEEPATATNDIPATPAARQRVNIADEKPVEEAIAEERARTAAAAKKDESKMSALDKLKAHMDKTVYADKEFVPKASGNYTDNDQEEDTEIAATTRPARSREPLAKKTEEKEKKKKEQLKAKSRTKTHTVRKGESLFEIAQKYDLTVSQLQKMNKLNGHKKIQPGMKLKVTK